jgi:addiction module RelE/StbE family toxin
MNYRVAFLPEAERDLDNIEEYMSKFYSNTARNFFLQLKKQAASLETMPYMYPAYDADPFFRRMVIDDYLLFYSVDDKRQIVIIHRIFHSKRDINLQILSQRTHSKNDAR